MRPPCISAITNSVDRCPSVAGHPSTTTQHGKIYPRQNEILSSIRPAIFLKKVTKPDHTQPDPLVNPSNIQLCTNITHREFSRTWQLGGCRTQGGGQAC